MTTVTTRSRASLWARRGVQGCLVLVLAGGTAAFTASQVTPQVDAVKVATPAEEIVAAIEGARTQSVLGSASRAESRLFFAEGEAVTFTLTVDGVAREIRTAADTLSEALLGNGVVIGWDDEVSHDLSAAPEEGAEVLIGRVTTTYVTEQVVTPHDVEENETATLTVGTRRVSQEGVDGDARVTYEVLLLDGVEIGRESVLTATINAPVTEIVQVGTRPVVAAAPSTSGSSAASGSGSGAEATAPVAAPQGDTRAIGYELLTARGYGDDQWVCLEALWTKESNWNTYAANRSSGAYGIPQSLPGSKMASAGADWRTNPATQITWGLNYIEGRYGTPCGAWSAFQSKGWY